MQTTKIDISSVRSFTKGVAKFEHLSTDATTGVQAWRRSYEMEPWRNRVEVFVPVSGRYYPSVEDGRMVRQIPTDDPKLREKVAYYLEHGVETIHPDDAKQSIFLDI